MLNDITIMGRMVRDPELRYTQIKLPVVSFTVAVDRDFGGRDRGDKQTDFIDCVAWRHKAEFVSNNFSKGSMVVVNGRLEIRDWTDKDGNKRRNAEINVENVYFGESKRKTGSDDLPPMPGDADAPPEVDRDGLAALAAAYPNNVEYVDPDQPLPWE